MQPREQVSDDQSDSDDEEEHERYSSTYSEKGNECVPAETSICP